MNPPSGAGELRSGYAFQGDPDSAKWSASIVQNDAGNRRLGGCLSGHVLGGGIEEEANHGEKMAHGNLAPG